MDNQKLARVRNPAVNLTKQPVTDAELMFVTLVIAHANSVYYAMSDALVVKYEGLRGDIAEFFTLPIPKSVWEKTKQFQNDEFVAFVEFCRNWK